VAKSKQVTVHALKVLVTRDPMTKIGRRIWPWELPILEAMFGIVEVTGSEAVVRDSLPDPAEELIRLSDMYGVEEESKQPYAEVAYGRGRVGIRELANEIANSTKPPGKTAAKKAAKPEAPPPPETEDDDSREDDGEQGAPDPLG